MTDVSPADVGARIVARHALPEGGATDVLGHLRSWEGGVLLVQTRVGDVRVPEDSLLALKRVPEAGQRRR